MKKISTALSLFFILASTSLFARDLTYKFGVGYQQLYTNGFIADGAGGNSGPQQVNGIAGTYGITRDVQVGAYFGFVPDFQSFVLGPSLRYDIQRLIHRDFSLWQHLNVFTKLGFYIKSGRDSKTGIVLQAPYGGFEIFPFNSNDFAILTSAGLTIDLMEENMLGFTNGMFGDVGVRLYF